MDLGTTGPSISSGLRVYREFDRAHLWYYGKEKLPGPPFRQRRHRCAFQHPPREIPPGPRSTGAPSAPRLRLIAADAIAGGSIVAVNVVGGVVAGGGFVVADRLRAFTHVLVLGVGRTSVVDVVVVRGGIIFELR